MHQQIVQPLSPWGNNENQTCKYFQNVKHQNKKPKFLRVTSGSISPTHKTDLHGYQSINQKPRTSCNERKKVIIVSIANNKSNDMLNFKSKIQIKNKSIGYRYKTIEYQKARRLQSPTRSTLRRQFITHQVQMNGRAQIPLPYQFKALGQNYSRIINKKQTGETAFKYSSSNNNNSSWDKPKTALCKKLNQMLRKGNNEKIDKILKLETYRSKIFNQQVQSLRNLNASQKQQRGTMLSKYSHKTFLRFKNNQQEQQTDTFLINNRRVSIVKTQKRHLLDRLLTKYE